MNQKLVIGVLLGSLTLVEAIDLSKKTKKKSFLPPYWDGVYSQTWRYTHPYWRAANEKEYVADQPKAYVAHSLAQ